MVNTGKEPPPGFLIEWFQQKVDEALKKHGTGQVEQKAINELLPNYDNPRNLPPGWLYNYLHRKPEQLAIDVIRAMDSNYRMGQTIRWQRRALYIMSLVVSPVIGEVVKLLLRALLK